MTSGKDLVFCCCASFNPSGHPGSTVFGRASPGRKSLRDRIAATLDRAGMTRRAACQRVGETVGIAQRADARHRSTRGVRGSFAPPSSAAAPSRRGIEAGSAPSSSPPTGRPVLRAGQCTSCGQDCGNRWVPGPSATCRWIEDALFKHGPKRSRPPTVRLTVRSVRQPRERPRWPAMPRTWRSRSWRVPYPGQSR